MHEMLTIVTDVHSVSPSVCPSNIFIPETKTNLKIIGFSLLKLK